METGIDFFNEHLPSPGDLWVVTSGPMEGGTTICRNLAVGIAEHLPAGRVAHWDLKQCHLSWRAQIEKMGCAVPASLDYRNETAFYDESGSLTPTLNRGAESVEYKGIVIDPFENFTKDLDYGLRELKGWLIRTAKFALVSIQLPLNLYHQLRTEGKIDPLSLSGSLLRTTDALFVCGRTPRHALERGEPERLRVTVYKARRVDAGQQHAFVWDRETGRIL